MKFSEMRKDTKNLRTPSMVITAALYNSINDLPPESRGRAWCAVTEYGMTGDAETYGDPDVVKILMAYATPIDKGVERYMRSVNAGKQGADKGKDGGRPTKEMLEILAAWNKQADELNLPKQTKYTGSLMAAIKALWAQGETTQDIIDTIHMVADSSYLRGDGRGAVKAHYAWLLDHYDDVKSGKYTTAETKCYDYAAPF